jgi:3-hydroxyisobutyrate dehydrogenase-like beta-hydroxyacid dehydrogenase
VSGCSEELFQHVKPLLDIWGTPTHAGTEAGMADALDFGILTYLQGIKFGYMQGLALAKQANVSPDLFLQFGKRYLGVYESVIEDINRKVETRNYKENINTTVDVLYNFFEQVTEHSQETGQSVEVSVLSFIDSRELVN